MANPAAVLKLSNIFLYVKKSTRQIEPLPLVLEQSETSIGGNFEPFEK
jgi:hypothetical protein